MMRTYYRKSYGIVGWAWWADVYCAHCGDSLPDVDPEGNDKHPIFLDQLGSTEEYCFRCGESCSNW